MRKTLLGLNAVLAILIAGLFVGGAVFAQDPPPAMTGAPEGPLPADEGGRSRGMPGFGLAEFKAVADLLSMTPGQLLDAELAGKTLLDIAKDKNVTEPQLSDAITAARQQMLDEVVKAGRLTQQQADQFAPRESGVAASGAVTGTLSARGGFPGGAGMSKAIADVLGMTPGELLDAQLGGKSLLDLAKDKGVTDQQVADAIIAARTDSLDQAVADGRLTQAQADATLAQMTPMSAADVVSRYGTLGGGPQGGPGGRGGPRNGLGGGRGGPDGPPGATPDGTATP